VADKQDGSATDKEDGSVVATGGLILNTVKAIQDGIKRMVGATASDDAIWRIKWELRPRKPTQSASGAPDVVRVTATSTNPNDRRL
jgi:hypothetical protein